MQFCDRGKRPKQTRELCASDWLNSNMWTWIGNRYARWMTYKTNKMKDNKCKKTCFGGCFLILSKDFSRLHSLQARPCVLASIFSLFAVFFSKHLPYPSASHFMLFFSICKFTHSVRGCKLVHQKRATFQFVLFHPENVGFLFLSSLCSRKSKRQKETKKQKLCFFRVVGEKGGFCQKWIFFYKTAPAFRLPHHIYHIHTILSHASLWLSLWPLQRLDMFST